MFTVSLRAGIVSCYMSVRVHVCSSVHLYQHALVFEMFREDDSPAPCGLMVDYSKWDKFALESDSEEEARAPVVTKLDAPTRVTLGSGPPALTQAPNPTGPPEGGAGAAEEWDGQEGTEEDYYDSFEDRRPPAHMREAEGGPDGAHPPPRPSFTPDWTRNGYAAPTHMFCQSLDEVTATVFVPAGARAKDVSVALSKDGGLTVCQLGSVVVTGKLSHEVHGMTSSAASRVLGVKDGEEGEGEEGVDWEVLDGGPDGGRLVRITLRKRPPTGLKVWWRKFFVGDACEVDVEAIGDRLGVDATLGRKLTMQEVWEKAHEEFRKKIAAQKPTVLDVHGEDEDEDV